MQSLFGETPSFSGLRTVLFVPGEAPGLRRKYTHLLPTYELVYKLEGNDTIMFGGKEAAFRKGCLMYLPKNTTGRYVDYRVLYNEGGSCIDLFFDSPDPLPRELLVFPSPAPGEMEALFRRAASDWQRKKPGYYARCMAALYRAAALLEETHPYAPAAERETLEPGAELLRRELAREDLRIEEAAAACGVSLSGFRHRFTRCYGRPPVRFLRELRVARAKDLLTGGRMTVAEVAAACGFADSAYFSRVFREDTGVAPSRWAENPDFRKEP